MATLQTQYKNYCIEHKENLEEFSYENWLEIHVTNLDEAIKKIEEIDERNKTIEKLKLPDIITVGILRLELKTAGVYNVMYGFNDNCVIGRFSLDVDGYYHFWYTNNKNRYGSWGSDTLRSIADALDVINKPYDDHIKEYFKNHPVNEDEINLEFE
jgi:hypothetical protein